MGAKLDFYKTALRNRAKKGFLGYPVATIAFYGPDDRRATKVALGVMFDENAETPREMNRWFSAKGDIRRDAAVFEAMFRLTQSRGVRSVAMPEEILGALTKRVSIMPRANRVFNVHSGRVANVLSILWPTHPNFQVARHWRRRNTGSDALSDRWTRPARRHKPHADGDVLHFPKIGKQFARDGNKLLETVFQCGVVEQKELALHHPADFDIDFITTSPELSDASFGIRLRTFDHLPQ
jgi:hypothetical protein